MTEFYKGKWTGGFPETASGSGSMLKNTVGVREFLPQVIQEYGIKSIFDAPCGDRNWIRTLDFDGLGCKYRGGDIVPELVLEQNDKAVKVFDIRNDAPPKVDLWFCRDCLFHLSEADIDAALENMVDGSTIKYLLVTSHTMEAEHHPLNRDIKTGDFRVLIFQEYGYFGLPEPLAIYDDPSDSDIHKVMMLFDLQEARK